MSLASKVFAPYKIFSRTAKLGVQQLRVGPENGDFFFDGGEVLVACREGCVAPSRARPFSRDLAHVLTRSTAFPSHCKIAPNSKCYCWCRLPGNAPFISLLNWTEDGLKWLIARLWTLRWSEMLAARDDLRARAFRALTRVIRSRGLSSSELR